MGRLFDNPWALVVITVVALLLFAAPKLPAMARSLGQSMRILRSEVREMRSEGADDPPTPDAAHARAESKAGEDNAADRRAAKPDT